MLANYSTGCVQELTILHPIADLSLFSFFPEEKECLLPPNVHFGVSPEQGAVEVFDEQGTKHIVKIIKLYQMQFGETPLVS